MERVRSRWWRPGLRGPNQALGAEPDGVEAPAKAAGFVMLLVEQGADLAGQDRFRTVARGEGLFEELALKRDR